ncbi:MAG: glycoside hydrolase family 3 N-terminal domain-containing protein [Gemmatimonadaceae bacterium]
MRLRFLLPALLLLPATATSQDVGARVDSLLRRLTLEEKVGEMTQVDIGVVTKVTGTATRAQQLDSAKLEEIVVHRNVGSLLNVAGVALTPAQWVELTSTIQRFAQRRRVPIPVLYGIDAVHGHQYMLGGTIFPQNIAMAATWNPALVRRANEITADETRASGIAWNFSPVLDVARQPLWSRFYETFGEDPYLASVMGVEAVMGLQVGMYPHVAATAKHFLGYSMPLSGKDRTTAWIPERQLREIFLPPFRAAIDAGVKTVMVNSGDINGIPVHSDKQILTDLLRTELGFKGVVISDWEDIIKLNTVHRVARTRRDAVRMALDAGIDMSMVPNSTSFIDDVISLVHSGEISEKRIDESVRRILTLKVELGLFEHPGPDEARLANANSAESRDVSRRAAEEAVTLVKNDRNMLPLKKGTRILVTGPGATSITAMHGGWTYTWQGTDSLMHPKSVQSLLAAMIWQFGLDHVTHASTLASATAGARDADVIVVALAEPAQAEKPGDIDDLTLPEDQLRLARAMENTGKPVIITLFAARPRTMHDVVAGARAVVLGYETGPFGGEALARVIAGEVNPSGRLPFTYPRSTGSIEHYDRLSSAEAIRFSATGGYTPEWDFGFGLSYTTFAYDSIQVAKLRDTLVVSVPVRNTGARDGVEVVQVYVRQMYASVSPPVRKLRDFTKITLKRGERRVVSFRIPVSRLAFVGRDNRLGVEPGEFEVQVGGRMTKFSIE